MTSESVLVKTYQHGLIVGKFAPLHRGHMLLLDAALEQCERVSVWVYSRPDFPEMPSPLRRGWIRALYPARLFPGLELLPDAPHPPLNDEPDAVHREYVRGVLDGWGARPDAVIVALYTPDHLLFSRQLMEQRLDLPFGIHSVGGGTEDPAFYKGLPQRAVDYVFVQEDWQIDKLQQTTDKTILAIAERTKEMLGYGMSAYAAQGVSAMYVLADALERSGSADREKLRDAIAASDIQSGPALITGYGRIKFDEQGQNTHAHGVISQNLNGERRTIWPAENRGSDTKPVWPVPAWSERKGS